jgi:hypothetical protein
MTFFAKYYNTYDNSLEPIRSIKVTLLSDITNFVQTVAKESGKTWFMLELQHIKDSLQDMSTNDWLKVAIQFTPRDTRSVDDVMNKFIIITQRADGPFPHPMDEYNLLNVSGTHSSSKYLSFLWFWLALVPYVLMLVVVVQCKPDLHPVHLLTKQYKEEYNGKSMV